MIYSFRCVKNIMKQFIYKKQRKVDLMKKLTSVFIMVLFLTGCMFSNEAEVIDVEETFRELSENDVIVSGKVIQIEYDYHTVPSSTYVRDVYNNGLQERVYLYQIPVIELDIGYTKEAFSNLRIEFTVFGKNPYVSRHQIFMSSTNSRIVRVPETANFLFDESFQSIELDVQIYYDNILINSFVKELDYELSTGTVPYE